MSWRFWTKGSPTKWINELINYSPGYPGSNNCYVTSGQICTPLLCFYLVIPASKQICLNVVHDFYVKFHIPLRKNLKIVRLCPVDNIPSTVKLHHFVEIKFKKNTHDTWPVTRHMSHVTCDKRNMVGGEPFLKKSAP